MYTWRTKRNGGNFVLSKYIRIVYFFNPTLLESRNHNNLNKKLSFYFQKRKKQRTLFESSHFKTNKFYIQNARTNVLQ